MSGFSGAARRGFRCPDPVPEARKRLRDTPMTVKSYLPSFRWNSNDYGVLERWFRGAFGALGLRDRETRGMMFELPDEVKTSAGNRDWRISQAVKGS
ncbi:hypothetical protein [Bifidobacterium parmae]|uniref:hypothetical protein n=1 Tax=Bifidobacterium parmae TaxID=361854 RepID=UPI0013FD7356|nr:hypothetical protein [Bifidobacterium parmae]